MLSGRDLLTDEPTRKLHAELAKLKTKRQVTIYTHVVEGPCRSYCMIEAPLMMIDFSARSITLGFY